MLHLLSYTNLFEPRIKYYNNSKHTPPLEYETFNMTKAGNIYSCFDETHIPKKISKKEVLKSLRKKLTGKSSFYSDPILGLISIKHFFNMTTKSKVITDTETSLFDAKVEYVDDGIIVGNIYYYCNPSNQGTLSVSSLYPQLFFYATKEVCHLEPQNNPETIFRCNFVEKTETNNTLDFIETNFNGFGENVKVTFIIN